MNESEGTNEWMKEGRKKGREERRHWQMNTLYKFHYLPQVCRIHFFFFFFTAFIPPPACRKSFGRRLITRNLYFYLLSWILPHFPKSLEIGVVISGYCWLKGAIRLMIIFPFSTIGADFGRISKVFMVPPCFLPSAWLIHYPTLEQLWYMLFFFFF